MIVKIIRMTFGTMAVWACLAPLAQPAVDPEPGVTPDPTKPLRLFDGGRWVEARALSTDRLLWDGHEVGYDAHALLWLEPERSLSTAELRRWGLQVVGVPSPRLNLLRVRGRANEDAWALSLRLMQDGPEGVRAVLPDIHLPHERRQTSFRPDDPEYPGQWFYDRIDIEDAWALETGDESVDIVVVDNGCDLEHPDLVGKFDEGRDVLDDDDLPSFEAGERSNEHGTACAGLVAASTNNGLGISGACPGCRLRCVRLLSDTQPIPLSADIAAYQFALDIDADVVSSSWGFVGAVPVPTPFRTILETLADEGRAGLGAVLVFAAGNDNREIGPEELQAVRGVIAVGATNLFDETAPFSNRGRAVDVVAPTGTLTTDISGPDGESEGDYTVLFGGTSSSCPIVAGIAGLLLSADESLTAARVAELLVETAEQSFFATPGDDGHDLLYGYGLVQPASALRMALGIEESGGPDAGVDMGSAVDVDGGSTDGSDLGPTLSSDAGPVVSPPALDEDDGSCATAGPPALWPLGLAAGVGFLRRRRAAAVRPRPGEPALL